MKKIFFIYWITYYFLLWVEPALKGIKIDQMQANIFISLMYLHMFLIPIGVMVESYVKQDKVSHKYLFYCISSFFMRICEFLMGILFGFRNYEMIPIYGLLILVTLLLETPFEKRAIKFYNKKYID